MIILNNFHSFTVFEWQIEKARHTTGCWLDLQANCWNAPTERLWSAV